MHMHPRWVGTSFGRMKTIQRNMSWSVVAIDTYLGQTITSCYFIDHRARMIVMNVVILNSLIIIHKNEMIPPSITILVRTSNLQSEHNIFCALRAIGKCPQCQSLPSSDCALSPQCISSDVAHLATSFACQNVCVCVTVRWFQHNHSKVRTMIGVSHQYVKYGNGCSASLLNASVLYVCEMAPLQFQRRKMRSSGD